jgi:hypothetical protein
MAVDEVVAARGDFREDHGALQIRCDHSPLIETRAMAGVGHIVQRDEFGAESSLGKQVAQEATDVELENPVGIELVPFHGLARPKVRVEIEPHRSGIRAR